MACILVTLFLTSQAHAFDIQFGAIDNIRVSYSQVKINGNPDNAWGALIKIPLGKSKSKQATTFNGQNVSHLTSKEKKLVIISLIGAVIILSIVSGGDLIWE